MCPSHLVEKWKREIDRLVPNAETYILQDYIDVINLEDKLRNRNRDKSIYLIVSKDKAKSNYDTRPVAIWNERLNTFTCPVCGKKLTKTIKKMEWDFEPADMARELKMNESCNNNVKVWNSKTNNYEYERCGAKLWATLNKNDEDLKWYKLGTDGWVHEDTLPKLMEDLRNKERPTKAESSLLKKIMMLNIDLNKEKEVDRFFRASSKYSISTYIKENLKGQIDYLIADELHLLKGESLQGQSFDDLVKASKHTIGLTGTLLNGYADSIFYLLYRTVPNTMIADGFGYNDVNEFIRRYGVYKETIVNKQTRTKKLPGISPVVFTKFLLENSVFVSLSDMSDGLPNYTEIPIGVDMSNDLRVAYENLEENFRRNVGMFKGMNVMGSYVQLLSTFPDKPYSNPAIYNPETGEEVYAPIDLKELGTYDSVPEAKLEEYIRITKEKVENGEKVLTYVSWTNTTDSAQIIKDRLKEEGINAEILKNVAPDKREEWIDNKVAKGMEVMICNPILVETGLDLLDFTTIIFYQLGYNIFTMRQASRRSWRLSQDRDIEVYFLYYKDTIQEQTLSLMANKLKASMAIEGKFSEEGLRAMSDNTDLMSQVANSIIEGAKNSVDRDGFSSTITSETKNELESYKRKRLDYLKERRFGGLNQTRPRENKILHSILDNPTKIINWY